MVKLTLLQPELGSIAHSNLCKTKTSIIQALIVALVAGVEVTEACASYRQCRCTMADGAIDNTIREMACNSQRNDTQKADSTAYFPARDGNDVMWCWDGYRGGDHIKVDNCGFRETCAKVGATGSDSWCQFDKD
ncbi:hypothetical protein LZ30DRAFT_779777 [Colletotrichum cereale]|nr:hypothetical protein LZ30DRAFT_779777 [Colletotrichum cereale]